MDSCLSPEPAARTLTNLRCRERSASVRWWDGPPVLFTLTAGWEDYRTKEVAADCMTVGNGSRVKVYVFFVSHSETSRPSLIVLWNVKCTCQRGVSCISRDNRVPCTLWNVLESLWGLILSIKVCRWVYMFSRRTQFLSQYDSVKTLLEVECYYMCVACLHVE